MSPFVQNFLNMTDNPLENVTSASASPFASPPLPATPSPHPAMSAVAGHAPSAGGNELRERLLVASVHVVGLTLALVGNVSIILIIAKTRRLHVPGSILILVLACSDLLLSLVWNLVAMAPSLAHGVGWRLQSGLACDVIGVTWQTMLAVSTLLHSVVALDRYLFIVHPMKYQVYVTNKAVAVLTCAVFLVAFLLGSFILYTGSGFRFHRTASMCIGLPIWAVLFLAAILLPSLAISLFAYQRIWTLCLSIFRQDDDIEASHGHTPRLLLSGQIPPLSHSTNSRSRSDLGVISDIVCPNMISDSEENNSTKHSKMIVKIVSEQSVLPTLETVITTTPGKTTTSIIDPSFSDTLTPVETLQTVLKDPVQYKTTNLENIDSEKERGVHAIGGKVRDVGDLERYSAAKDSKREELPVQHSLAKDVLRRAPNVDERFLSDKTMRKRSSSIHPPRGDRQPSDPYVSAVPNPTTSSRRDVSNVTADDAKDRSLSKENSFLSSRGTLHRRSDAACSNYETITRQLIDSESFLCSLLYVGLLMPLSMQPVAANKHKRLRACLLVGFPVCILVVSFIPFPAWLIFLGYATTGDNLDLGHGTTLVKISCHMSYALVPSITSLFLCLNNKLYRRALGNAFRCCLQLCSRK